MKVLVPDTYKGALPVIEAAAALAACQLMDL